MIKTIEVNNNTNKPILITACKTAQSEESGRIYIHIGEAHGNEVLVQPGSYSIIEINEHEL